jgi:predicted dehydrogenase
VTHRIRTGVVGCGKIGATHARALSLLSRSDFVAVCDPVADRASELGRKYAVRPYIDLEDMLEHERLDMVSICTPHPLHVDGIVKCATRGVHALVEKPLAAIARSLHRYRPE